MKKWMAVGALAFAFVAADQPVAYAQDDASDGAAFVDENGNGIDDAGEMRHRFGRRRIHRASRPQPRESLLSTRRSP